MPPRRYKVNHHKDKGSSYAGFIERNADVLPDHMLKKRIQNRNQQQSDAESGSESEGEKVEVKATSPKAPKVRAAAHAIESESDDAEIEKQFGKPGPQEGESRREREARQAEEAKKRYAELHAAGKTTEAKADLARLAEVRRRRELAASKKKEVEEKEASRSSRVRPTNPSAEFFM